MEITLSLTEFLRSLPAFANEDANLMLQTIDQVLIETDGYSIFNNEKVSKLAVTYHVAHILEINGRVTSNLSQGGQSVKRLKTKNDEIEFNVNQGDLFDFTTTQYGKRLQALIDRYSIGFTWGNFNCYC